jgi:hypothetical protein
MVKKGKKINVSYSEFSEYVKCNHKFLIEYVLRLSKPVKSIHMYFGSAIHDSIKKGLEDGSDLESRISEFKYKFKKDMMDNMADSFEINSLEEFTKQGVHIIKTLSIESIMKKYEIIAVEKFVNDKLYGNFFFNGYIDVILRDKKTGRYVIIDWKTSGAPWDEEVMKQEKSLISQMILYKYFYSKKYGIKIEEIDCKYVILNRLKNKVNPSEGYGEIQSVEIDSNEAEIEEILDEFAKSVRDIYIRKKFEKSKLKKKNSPACFFCPYKDGHKLCNDDPNQYMELLKEYS